MATLIETMPEGGTLVWSNTTSVKVFRLFNGVLQPFPVAVNGSTGSIDLPPGDYTIEYLGSDCDDTAVVEVFAEAGNQALLDAIEALTEAIEEMQAMQVEFDTIPVGCTTDEDGEMTGRVIHRTDVSEDDGSETQSMLWIGVNAATAVPYDSATHGEWGECPTSTACDASANAGLVSNPTTLWT